MVNYSASFPNALAVHGNEQNVLMLHKLDRPYRRIDGKMATYELEYRWLSVECQEESDEAWCCVQGSELTFWQRKEIDIDAVKSGRKSLFDIFNLFG